MGWGTVGSQRLAGRLGKLSIAPDTGLLLTSCFLGSLWVGAHPLPKLIECHQTSLEGTLASRATWCPWLPARLSPDGALKPQAIYLRLAALKTLLSKLAVTLR